ncbi:PREDICTED: transcriptional repressor CTCF-like isoform X1 [Rhagoletis zephyria]|uniref:transcriptional repressor CTCF-like isoform X1 n=1 Tax=Rhagoletis zephyria TaxID=28612 RepID=UPI0008114599|nr:PREDICTED: transcriptional repressor CTCF-like isoform X1 [Rhagoletis zephyria]XP_017473429.1 PREDICTED: transcriptional repressor CTCF-like isoform X1 [Rhagoletis zephyria]XP_017473430.1 PREDICTED: transcriptional repressor CTCF-like isoform X1 [Rhagoletis zephyria]XP_017473431.1 PREDICTED: transcriptional repressor CTCF-like isoform X1 [Rhagoletis zephyria]
MSESVDGDSEAQDLDALMHSIHKEITLCLSDELDTAKQESPKINPDEAVNSAEMENNLYYLDEGGNIYLTLNSENTSDTACSQKRIVQPELEAEPKRKAKCTKDGQVNNDSVSKNYMVYLKNSKVKAKSEEDVDDPNDEIYEFDELEEPTGSQEGQEMLLTKVIPVKATDSVQTITHKCPHCIYRTHKRYMLSRHMRSHSDDRPYICSMCDRGFKTNITLQNHRNVHLGNKPHPCLSCESRFTTAGDLARHVRYKHTFEKRHKCTECDYATVEMSKLRRHIRAHTGERPYQCPHCTYASPDSFKLKRHLRTHTGEKPYECDICQSRFTQSNSLKAHKLIHSVDDKPVFQCALCPTTCSRKSDLRIHVQKLHYSDTPIICKRCGKDLPDRYSYKMHVKTHEGERCYSCDQCHYKSISTRNLEMHKQIHSDEKPFECDKCGQTFRQKQLLGRHINIYHNENYVPPPRLEKTHHCPYCTRVFAHKGNMVRHMQLHDVAEEKGKNEIKVKVETEHGENILNFEDSYIDEEDETNSVENFEEYEIIEEIEEAEGDITIETLEPTTSKSHNVRSAKIVKPKQEQVKENKYGIKIENEFEAIDEDDESGLPGYMVVKVMQSDDELEDDGDDCVILTNLENVKPTDNNENKGDAANCFGFKLEEGEDDDEFEEAVFLNIVEEN